MWFIKVAYTSILFIEQLFLIDLCHFSTGIHNPQLRLHWTIADNGGGEIGFWFGFARLKHSLHFLIHFTRATTRIFMQLWTTREWKTNGKMLKSVLTDDVHACSCRWIYLLVTPAFATKKLFVQHKRITTSVHNECFLRFERACICVFLYLSDVWWVSLAPSLAQTPPHAYTGNMRADTERERESSLGELKLLEFFA